MNNHDSKKENSVLYLDPSEAPQITSVCYTTAASGAKVREEEKKIQAVRKSTFKHLKKKKIVKRVLSR